MSTTNALRVYAGAVVHRRPLPPRYRFAYRVFSVLLDIDRLDEADRRLRLFSHNRFNLIAIQDRDHGPRDGSPWRPWIESLLRNVDVHLDGGRVSLLCYPRVLGYAFNPLSVWYCHHRDGSLRALLCEVRNTFGEWHGYLLHRNGAAMSWPVNDRAAKVFHVSPFLPRIGEYHFRFSRVDRHYSMAVTFREPERPGPSLVALQRGSRRPTTDSELLRCAVRMPLMTIKVITAIHWQALKLWWRGRRYFPRPPLTTPSVTEGLRSGTREQ